jgi:DNA polymerase-3 subunit delta
MVAIKAHQADSFIKTLDPRFEAILLYGTDAGMVAERARLAAQQLAAVGKEPGEIIRIEDPDLDGSPDRLAVELGTIPMFGGRKIIRTTASRRINAQMLKPLLTDGTLAGALVVEAANLRPDDALRALFEKSPRAAAVACYADEARDLDALVREVIGGAGLTIAEDARRLLVDRMGADRALSRAELEKLTLYAADKGRIEADDVDAVVGDASELTLDRIVSAAASGDAARALTETDRAVAAGESPQLVIAAIERYFQRLHRVRSALDAGRTMDDAVRQLRPQLHFKQKPAFESHCRQWDSRRLSVALEAIARAARNARTSANLEDALAGALLLTLTRLAGATPASQP